MIKAIVNILLRVLNILSPVRLVVVAVVFALFWFLALGDQGIYQLRRILEMRNRLIVERKELNDDIDRLTKERGLLSDPNNLEMVIRKELGYIRPGEIIFEEKNSTVSSSSAVSVNQ